MELRTNSLSNNTTFSNSSCEDYTIPDLNATSKLLIYGFLIVIMILTIVLNITVIAKINFRPKHKLFTRFFLTSLASVDLCVGLTTMPFNILDRLYDLRELLGPKTCDLYNSVDVMLSSSSIIHLGILTFERYIAICKPLSYGIKCTKRQMKIFCIINWVLVILISFGIILPGYHQIGADHVVLDCILSSAHTCTLVVSTYYAVLSSAVSFFLPGVLILCFNVRVLKHVRYQSQYRRKILRAKICRKLNTGRQSQSMRVARTIAVLTGCFFVCWLPFFIVNVFSGFIEYKIPITVDLTILWLGYTNSAMNPLLYLLLEGKSCIGKS
ncbi:5-hydroxytryptamine receptor 4-like [Mercenaria mercenaria]|uniref:5-hydroxytryptamine receptor 4-like n=1 Tax=Mercenaria mercenaria TaxID=6596 RepID=UPI001E1D78D2|nr:5-hydroxytryptamine receptor 4-like [Mercenaria mercenaria]